MVLPIVIGSPCVLCIFPLYCTQKCKHTCTYGFKCTRFYSIFSKKSSPKISITVSTEVRGVWIVKFPNWIKYSMKTTFEYQIEYHVFSHFRTMWNVMLRKRLIYIVWYMHVKPFAIGSQLESLKMTTTFRCTMTVTVTKQQNSTPQDACTVCACICWRRLMWYYNSTHWQAWR